MKYRKVHAEYYNRTLCIGRVRNVPHRKGVKCSKFLKSPATKVPAASTVDDDAFEYADDFEEDGIE